MKPAWITLQVLVVGGIALPSAYDAWSTHRTFVSGERQPALAGIWDVDSFMLAGVEHPPLLTDADRWRRLIVTRYGEYGIQWMDDRRQGFQDHLDAPHSALSLASFSGAVKGEFTYSRPDLEHLVLEGNWNGQALTVRLKRVDLSTFVLLSRPFRWVTEESFNR